MKKLRHKTNTANEFLVYVARVDDKGGYPVKGAIKKNNLLFLTSWTKKGVNIHDNKLNINTDWLPF